MCIQHEYEHGTWVVRCYCLLYSVAESGSKVGSIHNRPAGIRMRGANKTGWRRCQGMTTILSISPSISLSLCHCLASLTTAQLLQLDSSRVLDYHQQPVSLIQSRLGTSSDSSAATSPTHLRLADPPPAEPRTTCSALLRKIKSPSHHEFLEAD